MNDLKPLNKEKIEKLLSRCFAEFEKSSGNLKDNYNDVDKYLKDMVYLMRDIHEVIIYIYGKYTESKSYDKAKILTIYPLVRTQIESIFNMAYLLRKPKEIDLFEYDSILSAYSNYYFKEKIIDEVLKTNELKERKEKVKKIFFNISPKSKIKEINKRFYEIEELIKGEDFPQWGFFPMPKRVLNSLEKEDKIKKILKFFYYIYKWLSSIVHGSAELVFSKEMIKRDSYSREKSKIEESLILSYLSILTVLTDLSSFINNPANLRGALTKAWLFFIERSYFAKYIYDEWVKHEFNIREEWERLKNP
jgi:hypothetical protein